MVNYTKSETKSDFMFFNSVKIYKISNINSTNYDNTSKIPVLKKEN